MLEHIDTFTDLLLGAAYADKRLEGRELESIRALLERVIGKSPLPAAQEARIKAFNPAKHDPKAAAATLAFLSHEDKRNVVDLIATVTEVDDEIDLAEDDYLRRVAQGLGMSDEEIATFTVQIIEDDRVPELVAKASSKSD
ncbi:tellurite resistance TerB family protein [Paraliomyxa miuraensis]|uniref:tellurite resistance TerB family protein n=1 Tax=Paraliomyxa miuraensis TaxID=376150 RepID=UPI002253EAA3|nr:TerB family tellurite resistance protein [Paraliomyxa miuraensis]MCX4243896.1 TerB family tellurite resistance protein [Paraliomyxa miuraensis]